MLAAGSCLAACGNVQEPGDPSMTVVSEAPREAVTETETEKVTVSEEAPAPAPDPAGDGVEAISPHFSAGEQEIPGESQAKFSVVSVRAGDHGSFDRFVLELTGPGQPSVTTNYTNDPTQQGSGHRLDVDGNVFLLVHMRGSGEPIGPFDAYQVKHEIAAGNIAGVASGGAFEGDDIWYIGLDKQRPYAIGVLENPTRLVVDVQK